MGIGAQALSIEQNRSIGNYFFSATDVSHFLNTDLFGAPLGATMIQTGESLMGSGVFNEDGSKLQVTATGSVSQDAVSLHIWTVVAEYGNQIDKSVDLDLVRVDRTISGSYQLYSGEEIIGSGNATASRAAA